MNNRRRRWPSIRWWSLFVIRRSVIALAFAVGGLVATSLPAGAEPPQIASKRAEAQRVLAEIESLDGELEQTIEAYNGATEQLAAIDRERAVNARHLTLARRNLSVAQRRLGDRLRALYVSGEEDSTIAILLGSRSLGDLIDRVETVSTVAAQDSQVVTAVTRFKRDVTVRGRQLKAAHSRQERVVAQRAAAKQQIEAGLAERRRLVASIKDEIGRLQAEERRRQERLRIEAEQRLAAQRAAAQRAAEAARQSGNHDATAATAPTTDDEPVVGASAVTPEGISVAPSSKYQGVVGIAMQYLGIPYRWGGASPETGFDCSGFIMYVYAKLGVSLPHYAAAQYNYGVPVGKEDLQPGDLVFFDGLGHNGMYIGGGQFIHAPHTGDVVKISGLSESWYASNWVGARRIL